MTMMLVPDLLDRRALALLALVDAFGRPVRGPVAVGGAGVRMVGKQEGRIAILNAPGFAEYSAAFAEQPALPAVRSQTLALDLFPVDPALLPRRVSLQLPRDPDPAQRDDPQSLFQPLAVTMSPSPRVRMDGNACILRVSVHRAGDGACVENALVRARSKDGAFTAWALTDPAGEAALVFPALPVSFPGAGGTPSATIDCSVLVHADPATARFADAAGLAGARRAAAARRSGFADPDGIAAANVPDFAAGASVPISAGGQPAIALQWTAP